MKLRKLLVDNDFNDEMVLDDLVFLTILFSVSDVDDVLGGGGVDKVLKYFLNK